MEEHENKQSDKVIISPFWTTPVLTGVLIATINFFCTDEEWKKYLTFLAPCVASIIAYILQYMFAIFLYSPRDFVIDKKLKRDEKVLVRQLKDAKKNPDLYKQEEIEDIRNNLAETRKSRSQQGRSSLPLK